MRILIFISKPDIVYFVAWGTEVQLYVYDDDSRVYILPNITCNVCKALDKL